ncbi:MAG: GNAT family N-acetyltransferase [Pseudomonadota bacterium]
MRFLPRRRIRPASLQRWERAADLPPAWDAAAGTAFRTRAFLTHAERTNPCRQRYWVWAPQGRFEAGLIAYELTLDLLTYRTIKSPLRMTVLGVPCSVAWPGLIGEPTAQRALLEQVLTQERGLVLGLNLPEPVPFPQLAQGPTLPTLVLEHDFADWNAYRAALRSDYRRRLANIQRAFDGVARHEGPCDALDEHGFRLYLGAYERSDAKLEKLPHAFLRELPSPFRLTRFTRGGTLLGWHIAAHEPGRSTFFMGGVDQALNERNKTYFNLLFDVIRQGIAAGSPVIDLGQTAEVPKLRTGALPQPRTMFASHHRSVARAVLRRAGPLLTWKADLEQPRVFSGTP